MAIPIKHPLMALTGATLHVLSGGGASVPILPPFADTTLHLLNPNFTQEIKGFYILEHEDNAFSDDPDTTTLLISAFSSHAMKPTATDSEASLLHSLKLWSIGEGEEAKSTSGSSATLRITPQDFIGDENVTSAVPLPGSNGRTWFFSSNGAVSKWRLNLIEPASKAVRQSIVYTRQKKSPHTLLWKYRSHSGPLSQLAVLPDHHRLVVTTFREKRQQQHAGGGRGSSAAVAKTPTSQQKQIEDGVAILSVKDGVLLKWIPLLRPPTTDVQQLRPGCDTRPPVVNSWTGWVAVAQNIYQDAGIWLIDCAPNGINKKQSSTNNSNNIAWLTSTTSSTHDMTWVGRGKLCVATADRTVLEYVVNEEESRQGAPTLCVVRELTSRHAPSRAPPDSGYYSILPARQEDGSGSYSIILLHVHPINSDLLTACFGRVPPSFSHSPQLDRHHAPIETVPLDNVVCHKFIARFTRMGWLL